MSFMKSNSSGGDDAENSGDKKGYSGHSISSGSGSSMASSGKVDAFLGPGSKVVGTLIFAGPVEVDGQIEGEIQAQEKLLIGEGAVINAKVIGTEIVVKGVVNGDIVASRKLSLVRPAKVVGNITASNLSIEEGVVFEGKCTMSKDGLPKQDKVKGVISGSASSEKVGASA